ncbi:hypothetical protein KL932_004286 [Ogataea haglerorum]|nr:hypothetical protein KL915_003960 [Ogataea haglerorum]KAG7703823.1 hypothetical protein KL950_004620 [Ogataea haglerorum]KAG7735622.1 hypothetical protein KL932_004286 [Ogataea haglerorum]KAG7736638.1 hypothetical protein KL923_004559 [Ogataea haglerorum]KAG7805289.1 hypothetical protein KL924_005006 [Ogataea haglerorum]
MSKVLTPYIRKLVDNAASFSVDDFAAALRLVFQGQTNDIELASFLTALRIRGLDFDSEYIATAVETILQFSDVIPGHTVDPEGYIDVVGTGGDGQNTFNVSTSAAIVGAGMGLKVSKHGGKASTSTSGAGDLMTNLGVELHKVDSKSVPGIVASSRLCFLFAPAFHHGMAKVAPVRASLGIPTIFNILGPLLNPIPIKARILGVYTEALGRTYCEAAVKLDRKSGREPAETMVVFGEVVLDEISPIGATKVWRYNKETGNIDEFKLHPADFGLPEHPLDHVRSGTPKENAELLTKILNNELDLASGAHPVVDYILMNAGALAVVGGLASSWKAGVELARKSVSSGAAKQALDGFVKAVNDI